ncbi:hypothetical protein NECAME_14942 [Necator americanus]|uniref:Uncharacterized protein n=1 Tax=Necator americanus TaxID=51031 RepID=W2SKR7_NECAM|nr:hypothetical protein NECAME_14942 [Necator americanus]ETN70153.1 hypothetical protein NECAME_14942 [Necator americanus]
MSGIFTIRQSIFHPFLAKALSILGSPCYVAYCVLTLILSINRFLIVVSPRNGQAFPSNLWMGMLLNFMWVFNSGVYPLIYIIVNRTIRNRILVKRTKTTTVSHVFQSKAAGDRPG